MPDTAEPLDRAKAAKPVPKPGIMDIHAYVPGKAQADGVANPIKLSANENILGSSPQGPVRPTPSAAGKLQPVPRSAAPPSCARAIAERSHGLEPERLLFGCGSDEVFAAALNQTYLEPGDNMVQPAHGFAAWAIGARACGAEIRNVAREPGSARIDVDALLKPRSTNAPGWCSSPIPANPTGTWIPFSEILPPARGPAAQSVVLVLDGAYSRIRQGPRIRGRPRGFRAGPARTQHRGHSRTFSKMLRPGRPARGLGLRCRPRSTAASRPHPPAVQRQRSPAQLRRGGGAGATKRSRPAVHRPGGDQWRPWLAQQLGGIGLETVAPSAANFVLAGFPTGSGQDRCRSRSLPERAKGYLVRGVVLNYGLPDHLRITIGLEEHNRAVVDALAEFMKA